MRGDDGKFAKSSDSLHPTPVSIKVTAEIREWIKEKGNDFHRQLLIDAWLAEKVTEPSPKLLARVHQLRQKQATGRS